MVITPASDDCNEPGGRSPLLPGYFPNLTFVRATNLVVRSACSEVEIVASKSVGSKRRGPGRVEWLSRSIRRLPGVGQAARGSRGRAGRSQGGGCGDGRRRHRTRSIDDRGARWRRMPAAAPPSHITPAARRPGRLAQPLSVRVRSWIRWWDTHGHTT